MSDTSKMVGQRPPPVRPTQRSNSSPVPSLLGGQTKLPPRSLDDSVQRRYPRDSDLFSPLVRTGGTAQIPRTPEQFAVRRDLSRDYGNELGDVGVPAVLDRRASDIIPAAVEGPTLNAASTSLDFVADLDVQAVEDETLDTLFSPPPRNDGDANASGLEGHVNGLNRSSSRENTSLGPTVGEKKVTSLPRGVAFSRLRKSASDVTPRNAALPPRPPRSSTHPRNAPIDAVPDGNTKSVSLEEKKLSDSHALETPSSRLKDERARSARPGMRRVRSEAASSSTSVGDTGAERKSTTLLGVSSQDSQPLVEAVRQTIVAEIDAVRQDLRGDLLNIHTELVLTSTRQTREIQQMFTERDKVIRELQQQVAQLRKENAELRAFVADE